MKKDEFVKEADALVERMKEFDAVNEKVEELFGTGSGIESVFFTFFYRASDQAMELLSKLAGDENDWVNWYVYEVLPNLGAECTVSRKKFFVESAGDLWEVINYKQGEKSNDDAKNR